VARRRHVHARAALERTAVDGVLGRRRARAGVGGAETDGHRRGLPAGGRVVGRRRRRVVDAARHDRGGADVAGRVGRERAQVVDAVGGRGRGPGGRGRGPVTSAGGAGNCTCATPEPASAAAPVSVIVPRTFAAGSSSEVVGAVLSTRTSVTGLEAVTLPAWSVATTRSS